jgi:hypothetical protein
MIRNILVTALALLSVTVLPAQTADEIIARNIEAKGGMQKLQAIKTMRQHGKVVFPGGFELRFTQTNKRPEMVRTDQMVQGMNIIQAYDGKNGWQIDPTQGRRTSEALSEEDLRQIKEDADLDGPLVNYKEKGHTVEYLGEEDFEGSPVYKLKVTLQSGDVKTFFIDTDAALEIKIETKRFIRGAERETETVLGDYKDEGGVMMAHSFESKQKGATNTVKASIDKVDVNPEVTDSFFQDPGSMATAPKAEAKDKTEGKKPPAKKDKPKS